MKVENFGRIAAQTAKQVIIQGIREAERGAAYDSYSSKAQEILTGTVLRMDPSGDMYHPHRHGQRSAPTPCSAPANRSPGRLIRRADLIRVYVVDVRPLQPRPPGLCLPDPSQPGPPSV